MDVEIMKRAIFRVYPSRLYEIENEYSVEQITAIYTRLLNAGQLKEKSK